MYELHHSTLMSLSLGPQERNLVSGVCTVSAQALQMAEVSRREIMAANWLYHDGQAVQVVEYSRRGGGTWVPCGQTIHLNRTDRE